MPQLLPIRSESHVQESISVRKFSEIMSPWKVTQVPGVEYGNDVSVEITRKIDDSTKNRYATNLNFNTQLKSSKKKPLKNGSRRVSVNTSSVHYWYGGNLPTMLAYLDENTQDFYFKWIDDNLITELDNRSPNWRNNETVTIRLSDKIPKVKDSIENYVCQWRLPLQNSVPSETYFEVNKNIESIIHDLFDLAREVTDSFLKQSLADIKSEFSKPIYSIGIAGESRTGKSTLINSILQREVTPTGLTKTTGVPVSVSFALEEECVIRFENKKEKRVKIDFEVIKEFASQDRNKGNKKRVESINLKINNPNLEKGIYIHDLPGLNDANDDIRNLTKSILFTTNAVVYVLNGGLMETGDFIIHKSIAEDLRELHRQKDYVFIVVNKVDNISKKETFKILKDTIIEEFADNQLGSLNPDKFLYISAKNSFKGASPGDFAEDVSVLNKEIWRYLLKNNKTGTKRLSGCLSQLASTVERAYQLESVKLLNSKQKAEIKQKIKNLQSEKLKISKSILSREEKISKRMIREVKSQVEAKLLNLDTQLKALRLNEPLFTEQQIELYLKEEGFKILVRLQENFNFELNELQNLAAEKIQELLQGNTGKEKLTRTKNPSHWIVKNLFVKKQSNSFIEAFLSASVVLISEFIEGIANIFKEKQNVRKKKIDGIMKKSSRYYKNVFGRLEAEIESRTVLGVQNVVQFANHQIELYINSLQQKLQKTGEAVEPHKQEQTEKYLKSLEKQLEKIEPIAEQLKPYM